MTDLLYPVCAEWDAAAQAWSILVPDFPEIASVATSRASIAQTATGAIETAVEVRVENGEPVPSPTVEVDLPPAWEGSSQNVLLRVSVSLESVPST